MSLLCLVFNLTDHHSSPAIFVLNHLLFFRTTLATLKLASVFLTAFFSKPWLLWLRKVILIFGKRKQRVI